MNTPADPADVEDAARFVETAGLKVGRTTAALGLGRQGDQAAGLSRLSEWLGDSYDHPLWQSLALRCHGCGACAAVCPTCHCFDIVDEHDAHDRGARRRNWDTCQSSKFTRHASGHNPRATQTERLRQRWMHKFHIYPRRFGVVSCTGCGRCVRACAAGTSVVEILGRMAALAGCGAAGGDR